MMSCGPPNHRFETLRRMLQAKGYRALVEELRRIPSPEISGEDPEEIISEIYRRCFALDGNDALKQALRPSSLKVLSDFAAHFPHIIFTARWVADLMAFMGRRKGLVRALAQGFRRASERRRPYRTPDSIAMELRATEYARGMVHAQLNELKQGIDLSVMRLARDRSAPQNVKSTAIPSKNRIADFIAQLAATHPVLKPSRQRLAHLLETGKFYDAENLVLSRLFGVPLRKLERSTSPAGHKRARTVNTSAEF